MRTERNIPLTIWTLREQVLSARFTANFAPIMFNKHEEEFEVCILVKGLYNSLPGAVFPSQDGLHRREELPRRCDGELGTVDL